MKNEKNLKLFKRKEMGNSMKTTTTKPNGQEECTKDRLCGDYQV